MARRSYTVKKDDDWFKIATKTNNQPDALARANPNINTLSAGQVIDVPTTTIGPEEQRRRAEAARPRPGGPPVAPRPRPARGGRPGVSPPFIRPPRPGVTEPFIQPGGIDIPPGEVPTVPPIQQQPFRPPPFPDFGAPGLFPSPVQPAPVQLPSPPEISPFGGPIGHPEPEGQFARMVEILIGRGIAPLVIPVSEANRLGMSDLELAAAGYELDNFGNWIRQLVIEEPSTDGPSTDGPSPGARDYYRRWGGGGRGSAAPVTPQRRAAVRGATTTGRRPGVFYTGTGRRVDPLSMGLINWRI